MNFYILYKTLYIYGICKFLSLLIVIICWEKDFAKQKKKSTRYAENIQLHTSKLPSLKTNCPFALMLVSLTALKDDRLLRLLEFDSTSSATKG